ncbi:hypothetical protein ACP4OV_008322 [Aristida adscensionis]
MASRSNTIVAAAAAVAVVLAVAASLPAAASAETYKVGDDFGWDIGMNYLDWAQGKTFKVGDTLEFVYSSEATHNVALVDSQGYDTCTAASNAPTESSGDDTVTLDKPGKWFFICSVEGHCQSGMYLAINVEE